jgi:hypothetical protein
MLQTRKLKEKNYLLALRLDLDKATVMPKCASEHVMVNRFNPALANLWDGNCDMQ